MMNAYRKEEKPVRLKHGMSKAQHTTCACVSLKGGEGGTKETHLDPWRPVRSSRRG